MEIKFEVKMTTKIMYDFLLNHTYKSFTGIFGVIFGLAAFVVFGSTLGKVDHWQSVVYAVFGAWFLLYLPVSLYTRSVRQVKLNPAFKKPIRYLINEEGISSSQEELNAQIPWENMIKVRETKLSLLVYTGKRYSFVLPKESMGEQYSEAVNLIRRFMDPQKVKIKG